MEPERAVARSRIVHEVFARRAAESPDAAAILAGGRAISYAELDAASDAAARRVAPGRPIVAVRSADPVEAVVRYLGVLKAGAAYLPIDPTAPEERVRGMLQDAGAESERSDEGVEAPPADGPASPTAFPPAGPDSPACVYFTSGTTGRPKGVLVPHRGIVRLVADAPHFPVGPGDVVARVANPAFDASTLEVWGALLNGAALAPLPRESVLSPGAMRDALRSVGATVLFLTPAVLRLVVEGDGSKPPAALAGLRVLLFGGERCDGATIARVFDAGVRRVIHLYGPTEASTATTAWTLPAPPVAGESIPIGAPIPGDFAEIRDPATLAPVPEGVAGELFVGGEGLALGYVGPAAREEEARFLDLPSLAGGPPRRAYRTGDLARRRPDGLLEFVGRVDAQFKLRGVRIEPEEVERALEGCPGVARAAVFAETRGGDSDSRRLVALVVPRDAPPDPVELRARLARVLPRSMIPATIARAEHLPLTANGKIDRARIAGLAREPLFPRVARGEPRGLFEERLLALWESLLETRPIGVHDDFFDLGGDSLLAARAAIEIERACERRLPLDEFLAAPTVAAVAERLHRLARVEATPHALALRPGNGDPERAPLFFAQAQPGSALLFADLARLAAPESPAWALQAEWLDARAPRFGRVEEFASVYLEAMRAIRPRGPYRLGGYCLGGLVAFEMARRLRLEGEVVEPLFLLDAPCVNAPWLGATRGIRLATRLAGLSGEREARAFLLARQSLLLADRGLAALPDLASRAGRAKALARLRRFPLLRPARSLAGGATPGESPADGAKALAPPAPPAPPAPFRFDSDVAAGLAYVPEPCPGGAVLIRTRDPAVDPGDRLGPALGWEKVFGEKVEVRVVPGDHLTFMLPPLVAGAADALRSALADRGRAG